MKLQFVSQIVEIKFFGKLFCWFSSRTFRAFSLDLGFKCEIDPFSSLIYGNFILFFSFFSVSSRNFDVALKLWTFLLLLSVSTSIWENREDKSQTFRMFLIFEILDWLVINSVNRWFFPNFWSFLFFFCGLQSFSSMYNTTVIIQ